MYASYIKSIYRDNFAFDRFSWWLRFYIIRGETKKQTKNYVSKLTKVVYFQSAFSVPLGFILYLPDVFISLFLSYVGMFLVKFFLVCNIFSIIYLKLIITEHWETLLGENISEDQTNGVSWDLFWLNWHNP